MHIKEVEELLSVSRSNIRFYEKAGLLTPERKENNYRDYSEQDVAALKKILVCRKLGFTVEEIASMQKGELSLTDAAEENIRRLEKEMASLSGALEMSKSLSAQNTAFDALDQEHLWNEITRSESDGQAFLDICKDYLTFELQIFDHMWRYVFLHDFKKSRQKYGIPVACGVLLLICVVRGITMVVIWKESFWDGFLYPLELFLIATLILLPLYLLSKKAPKAASVIGTILLILGIAFLAFCVLLILYGVIRSIFATPSA